ncbi:MAG: type II toxin-antitoxin system Phd/YefM family antitoxin [Sphingomonadales bacterium]|nr:MAG: type II toxin-antitoxin system Phd/YefM family antitoxin [Sphingomonadales bacterium]
MKMVTSREFNQDVSFAKRLARMEPVIVTDRGRPTHVLLSIDAYRRMSGQPENLADLLAAPEGADMLDPADLRGAWGAR